MALNTTQDERIIFNDKNHIQVCYKINITQDSGLWKAESALTASLPIFVTQLALTILVNRIAMILLKPLRQPRIVAEILGGVILGPSGLALTKFFHNYVFPYKSIITLETVANLSLVYYMFLVGLETDFTKIARAGKKAYCIALTGILVAIPTGYGLFYQLQSKPSSPGGGIFWAIALSCTNFPDLARILADVKLLRWEIGRLALTSALINDVCSWFLLVFATTAFHKERQYAVLSTVAFVIFCVFALRPALKWIIRHTTKEDNWNEFHICFVLAGVLICGFITDACGAHSIPGAFMLGVIMPKGELKDMVMEKAEDFVSGIMMPIIFVIIGLRVNVHQIASDTNWGNAWLVIGLACLPKVVSTFLVSLVFRMPPLDGLALGLLMNTKGLLALIALCSGRDLKALDNQTFSTMVVAFCLMTVIVEPFLVFSFKRSRRSRQYNRRNIQSIKPDTEFRILACVHSARNVSGITNLVEASNPTQLSPICVYAVHLVELTGRASSMLIVHDMSTKSSRKSSRTKAQSESILTAFENLESQSNFVSVQPLTAVSPYESMHEDICSIAEDKRVTLIIIPFHKESTINGGMEDTNPPLKGVNQNVLANAPCSVGILVDRGLSVSAIRSDSNHGHKHRFMMLFIGGPDDREALAYAWRMCGHPSVSLTVVRLVSSEDAANLAAKDHRPGDNKEGAIKTNPSTEKEKHLDNEYMAAFRQFSMINPSVNYLEKVVNNGEETLNTIGTMDHDYDLYIVGRGEGMKSPLTSGLTEWSDFPELGALGDTLVSSSFASNVSVLIVQQHTSGGGGGGDEGAGSVAVAGAAGVGENEADETNQQDRNGCLKEQFGHMTWQPRPKNNADLEPFVHRLGDEDDDDDEY